MRHAERRATTRPAPPHLLELDRWLSPPKARLARRLLLAGRALEPRSFAARGYEVSAAERERLAAVDTTTAVASAVVASDGSVRIVIALPDGDTVETVAMTNGAVCVSTQVGCAVQCRFCASGLDGLRRNLSAVEIVEQVLHARRRQRVDRVVFMGIGEPSHNLPAVLEAVSVLGRDGSVSPRKQTLSTVGSVSSLQRLASAPVRPCLALSLHAADPELRRRLLPHASRDALPDLIAAADAYGRLSGVPVQIEWTVLHGVNDHDGDVDALCELLRGVRGYVNFIVWNPVLGLPFERPRRERVVAMVRAVKRHGILATIRDSAGADVQAACGQLRRSRR